MPNWYCTREAVKGAGNINTTQFDARIDRLIEAASRALDRITRRFFIPRTQTRTYRWPNPLAGVADRLYLDQDLLSVTTLLTKAQDTTPTTIAASDFFLEPNIEGLPARSIEIDQSSDAAFESGDTPQRSISVAGSWGFGNETAAAGSVASGLASSSSATEVVVTDGGKIGVGDTLLIESEQVFVSGRAFAALDSIKLDEALTADVTDVTATVEVSHGLVAGETIQVGSERMLIQSILTNDLTVIRAVDGSFLAAHSDDAPVQVTRTLTIVRGVNGTTAATHANSTAITKYQPVADIVSLCVAQAISDFHQENAGWGRSVGQGEGAQEFGGRALAQRWADVTKRYFRARAHTAV